MFLKYLQHPLIRFEMLYNKQKYENILDDRDHPLWKKLYIFIQICVLIGVFSLMLASIESLYYRFFLIFFITDFVISSIFLLEYLYRFKRAHSKKWFFLSVKRNIELLSFAPHFIGLFFIPFAWFDILKVLRLFRVLRLLDVTTDAPLVQGFLRTVIRYKREYTGAFGIFFSSLVVFSSIVYYFEHGVNIWFENIFQSLWWGVVTMTTVWYGDIAPITIGGKIFASFLVFLGPLLLALCSSITILVFMDVAEHSNEEFAQKVCTNCGTQNPLAANYCFHCGNKKFSSNFSWSKSTSWAQKLLKK